MVGKPEGWPSGVDINHKIDGVIGPSPWLRPPGQGFVGA